MKSKNCKKGLIVMMSLIIPCLGFAVKADSQRAVRLNDEGVMLMKKNDANGAINKFRAAIDADRTCMSAYHNLGKLLIVAKQYDAAIQLNRNGLSVSPSDQGCLVQLVQAAALAGNAELCRNTLKDGGFLKKPNMLPSMALLLAAQKSYSEAEFAIDIATAQFPKSAECWYNKGIIHERQNKWASAESAYARAVAVDPKNTDAWINRGNMQDRLGNADNAIASYEKAYALSPDSSLVLYNLGRMLVLTGRNPRRGLALLQKATKCGISSGAPEARELLLHLVKQTKKGAAK